MMPDNTTLGTLAFLYFSLIVQRSTGALFSRMHVVSCCLYACREVCRKVFVSSALFALKYVAKQMETNRVDFFVDF